MPKNPRRAYDAQGTELPPRTVGDHLAAGFQMVEITCAECHHHASIDVSALPPGLPVPDISLRTMCSACGSRRCTSAPDIAEFYAKLWPDK